MNIPPLCSPLDPTAPIWAVPTLTLREKDYFKRAIVMIAAVDEFTGELEGLGSGFLINAEGEGVVSTASHVIMDWVNRVHPRAGNYVYGLEEPTDEANRRLGALWNRKLLRVLFNPPPPGIPRICTVDGVQIGLDPMERDAAILFFPFPRELWDFDFQVLPIDTDAIGIDETVIVAGYTGMNFVTERTGPNVVLHSSHKMVFRACRVTTPAERAGLIRGDLPMLRANVPLDHGMSGGPLIRVRHPLGPRPQIIGDRHPALFTASGINSSGWYPDVLAGDAPEGVSWITPLESILDMAIRSPIGTLHLRAEIEARRFVSYASIRDDLIAGRPVMGESGSM